MWIVESSALGFEKKAGGAAIRERTLGEMQGLGTASNIYIYIYMYLGLTPRIGHTQTHRMQIVIAPIGHSPC